MTTRTRRLSPRCSRIGGHSIINSRPDYSGNGIGHQQLRKKPRQETSGKALTSSEGRSISVCTISRAFAAPGVSGRRTHPQTDVTKSAHTTMRWKASSRIATRAGTDPPLVPVVPVSVLTHGNEKIGRRRSGNTVCSRRSRRSETRGPRMRAGLPFRTYLSPERRERREREGGSPLPYRDYLVPVNSEPNGNDGNETVSRGWSS